MDEIIKRIAERENTAFYVFDSGELKRRVRCIRASLPENIALCYAVKANTFISGEIADEVERFEICSPGEAEICRKIGIDSRKMVISGIYKTPSVMESMIADESFDPIYTVESLLQYELFRELSAKSDRKLRLLLRLTNSSQFGMNASDIERIITENRNNTRFHILGIQFFSGTQKDSVKKYKRELDLLDRFLIHLKDELGFEAEELEYGTGFPVAYFEEDELDEDELFREFSAMIGAMTSKPKITLELGRSIAASCGRYFTHIVDIKTNKGMNYALTDGGMHHLVYFGQHMAIKKPHFSVVGKPMTENGDIWTICGSLCSMNDLIVKQVKLPEIAVGDLLCFENTGAYCATEGISLFLSRDIPAVYLIRENGETFRLRRSFETDVLNTPNYEII